MHIAFIIPNIEAGGAERVASFFLCNFWAARGHRITLVTFERLEATPFYPLHDTIAVHRLQACGARSKQSVHGLEEISAVSVGFAIWCGSSIPTLSWRL